MDKREECLKWEQRMLQVHNKDPKLIWLGREETTEHFICTILFNIQSRPMRVSMLQAQ